MQKCPIINDSKLPSPIMYWTEEKLTSFEDGDVLLKIIK